MDSYKKTIQKQLTHYQTKCDVLKEELEKWKQNVAEKEKEMQEKNKLINQMENVQASLKMYKNKFADQELELRQSISRGATLKKRLADAEAEKQAALEDNISQFDAQSEYLNLFKEGLTAIVDPDYRFVSIQY